MSSRKRKGVTRRLKQVVNRYHVGDARQLRKFLPTEGVIDVTITSPPYWNLKDYGSKSQIGFGQSYERYLNELQAVFRAVYAVTREKGSLWIISDTVKRKGEVKLLPFDLAERLKGLGWILQDIIIWNKDKTLPWSHQGKLRNIFEYITFFTKSGKFNYHLARIRDVTELRQWWVKYPERYSPDGKAPARTWNISIPRQGSWGNNWVRHFNPLPPQLVERILLLTTNKGDVVLDPFCGSGAVLAQARVMKRGYIGLDLNSDYRKMFQAQVLPAISRMYERNTDGQRNISKQKTRYRHLIRSLRKTKYPKEMIRLYRNAGRELRPACVLAVQGSNPESLEITFLFAAESDAPDDFLARAYELTKRPPLSKYGITVVLSTSITNAVTNRWLKNKGLVSTTTMYVYGRGCTHRWARRVRAAEWFKDFRTQKCSQFRGEKYPPIVSDVSVRLDPSNPFGK